MAVECDLAVVGTGAAGLAGAVAASEAGLSVLVLEKTPLIGGTTAVSEGMIWVPMNEQARSLGLADSEQAAVDYLLACGGNQADASRIRCYVANAARVLKALGTSTPLRFRLNRGSIDYYPTQQGATKGRRALNPEVFDARRLGRADLGLLRPPLPTMMLLGGMSVASSDVADYYSATRSPRALWRVVCYGLRYATERLAGWPRGARLGNGNALVASLLLVLRQRKIVIRTQAAVSDLIVEHGRVVGLRFEADGKTETIVARRGVLLASGSFSTGREAIERWLPHRRGADRHLAAPPEGAEGDGIRLAEQAGAALVENMSQPALWSPASLVPLPGGASVWPHFSDRAKPGVIIVDRNGNRFANEALPYRDFVAAMIEASPEDGDPGAHLILDHAALRKYGVGPIGPWPLPFGRFVRSGYLARGASIADLARKIGIDATALQRTVQRYNESVEMGRDQDFGKGESEYDRNNGDASATHPNLRALGPGPFYAIRIFPGDLGTFVGVATDDLGRVTDRAGKRIPGLYAAGNVAAAMTGGAYPAAGLTVGAALVFGFMAGEMVAQEHEPAAIEAVTAQ